MIEPVAPAQPEVSWLAPTWGRLVVAAIIATLGFVLPQEVPLEWYPLNEPGTDINYLEISCASNVNGEVQIRYDVGTFGNRPIDNIIFPISPTTQTFTYTFPLPDAPIVELKVAPPKDGELTIRQMRIINRRNEEIRRFTRDLFRVVSDVSVVPLPEGWKLVSAKGASAPLTRIELFSRIIPVGMNHRNLLRCLLSTGYLAGMLFILLMAVLTATWRPRSWRDFFIHASFMAGLAVLFAPVGNRGLIRSSIHFARYVPPPTPPGLKLEFDLTTTITDRQSQLFWDTGSGFNETESLRLDHERHSGEQVLRFPLPERGLKALRFDPPDGNTKLGIYGIRVVDGGQRTRLALPLTTLTTSREIARLEMKDDQLLIETNKDAQDPILEFSPDAIARINRVFAAPALP